MKSYQQEPLASDSELTKEELQELVFEILGQLGLYAERVTNDKNDQVFFRLYRSS